MRLWRRARNRWFESCPVRSIAERPATEGTGHGLDGMRERVATLNGTLLAGPREGGGFAVRADLPVVAGCRQTEMLSLPRFLIRGLRFYVVRDDKGEYVFLVLASLESDTKEIQSLYQQFLHRAADAFGLQGFVNALQSLGTFSQEALSRIPQWSPTTPDATNPNFQQLLVTGSFTRNDGTAASVGEYLVNRRARC